MIAKMKGYGLKRIIALVTAVMLSVNVLGNVMPMRQVEAKNWTKSQVKKELKKTKEQIKSVKAKYNKAKKAWEKSKKGTISILGAQVLSSEPLVIYYPGLLGIGEGYYWIESGTQYFSELIGTGVIKKTGGYREYSGFTCTLAKGVKVDPSKKDKLEARLNKLKDKKTKLNHALKNKAVLDADLVYETYNEGYEYITPGETYDIYPPTLWTYADEEYSYPIYTSSDTSIATVDEDGILTAKKPGTVTITVKTSISGVKTKTNLVIKEAESGSGANQEDDDDEEV